MNHAQKEATGCKRYYRCVLYLMPHTKLEKLLAIRHPHLFPSACKVVSLEPQCQISFPSAFLLDLSTVAKI